MKLSIERTFGIIITLVTAPFVFFVFYSAYHYVFFGVEQEAGRIMISSALSLFGQGIGWSMAASAK